MRLLLAFAASLSLAAATVQPQDLLQRAARASGEPWRVHVVSILFGASEGRLTRTRIDAQGDRVVTRRCSGEICSGVWIDGLHTAVFSYNETPIPQRAPNDPLAITMRAITSYHFTAPEFRANGGRVVELAQNRFQGNGVVPFRITAPEGATLDALVDPTTALLVAIAGADGKVLARFSDERRVGNLQLPFTIERGNTVERFEERTVDPEPLRPPMGPPITFSSPQAVRLTASSPVPRFGCTVEKIAATCLLDTGASGLAMSLDLADRLGKNPTGQLELQGLGSVATGVVRADTLQVGAISVGPALYAILPDARGFNADVVLGADIIGRCIVRLDLAKRTIAFEPSGSRLEGDSLPIAFEGFTPYVRTRLGEVATELAIDTGDEASIDLPIAFYKSHPDLFRPLEKRTIIGVGGRGVQSIGRIARVELGGIMLSDVPIGATDIGANVSRARLGAGFFARTRLVLELDYAHSRAGLLVGRTAALFARY